MTGDGRNPFREWLETVDGGGQSNRFGREIRFELGNLGDHKSVGAGVWEARMMVGPAYRRYFGKDGESVIV